MTKIRIMSDLHLEFGPLTLDPAGEDVLVLAGDIGSGAEGVLWADEQSKRLGVPVVMIAGNHEFYKKRGRASTLLGVVEAMQETAAKTEGRVTFLEKDWAVVAGVRFVGATLWTDFALDGDATLGRLHAGRGMADYDQIVWYDAGEKLTPQIIAQEHGKAKRFIAQTVKAPFDGQTVVMTHHAPSRGSVAEQYVGSTINPAFASNLDYLVAGSGAALWVHGHMHNSFDYMIGETRVIVNPRGYYFYEINPEFDPNLVVEV